ncbi:hypothetical protein [Pantoea eucrina]|uniref:tail fiber/spike domain-containing protein n=1 Tax=Pantoea eucrina TaxID=472693 RepID=UPI00301D147E
MTTQPTQNRVPSESPRDLKFNAGKIDEFVTSLVNTYVDRFGSEHYTIEGLRWLAQQAISQYGWIPVGTFQAGATLTLPNQILKDTIDGEYYRWDGALPKTVPSGSAPESSGGIGVGSWISIGDSSLRQYLFDNGFLIRTVKYYGATGDGLTNDSAAFSAADSWSLSTGQTIRVTKGGYLVKNLQLSGSWVFDDDASIIGNISGTENVILAGNGLRLENCTIKRTLSSAPADGDFGNAIRIGTYRQPAGGTNSNDIKIKNAKVFCLGDIQAQSIEMLGDVYNVDLDVTVIGPGGAVVAHWGGDVGDEGHSSTITYTYHPHDLRINVRSVPDSSGVGGTNSLILSACYGVIANVYSESATRTFWCFPGDVYDAVAVARDKGKVCTGIKATIISNQPVNSSSPAIHLSGMPATPRTSSLAGYGIDTDTQMDFDVNASINCGTKAYTSPLVIVEGVSTSKIKISKTGSDIGAGYWAQVRYCSMINAEFNGWSHQGVRVAGVMGSAVTINGACPEGANLDVSRGCDIQTFVSGAFSVVSAISTSSSSMSVSASGQDAVIFAGTYLTYLGNPVARVMKSYLCKAGVTVTVPVQGVISAVPAGASVAFSMPCEGTVIRGALEGFLNNYVLVNAWGVTLDVDSKSSKQHSIVFNGNYIRGVRLKGSVERTGRASDLSRSDIFIPSTITLRGLAVSMNFDPAIVNPYVSSRLQYSGTNHTGLIVSDCVGTPTLSGISFSIANSDVNGANSQAQIYGNKVDDFQAPNGVMTGMYAGNVFIGNSRNDGIPTTGYWSRGSRLYNNNIVAGGQEGYVCTASGSPGTWKGFGVISS